MSTRQDGPDSPPISSRDELAAWLEAGCKPADRWVIGTEHEKFGFRLEDLAPIPYEGEGGVRHVLDEMTRRYGYRPVVEGGNVIALVIPDDQGGGTVSLEPGGQLELSGGMLKTLHETAAEVERHASEVHEIGRDLGIGFLGLGFSPLWSRAATPVMPKGRYGIMTRYMPKVGRLGLDMMYRSATVQVNLDFASEADMVRKLRVSLALQPVASALAANSPLSEGRINGFKTFRCEVWRFTDPDRTGLLPFAFEEGMGFERYVDYALDVPMYFAFREGRYIDLAGRSFRDFLEGRLEELPGERPSIDDWADHVSTIFPEVRMKRFLEMRGADAGGKLRTIEIPAFWVGLLYDSIALDEACELIKGWSAVERHEMRRDIPRLALDAPFRHGRVGDIAREALAIARRGLARRARLNAAGEDETRYLQGLEEIAETGVTDADRLIHDFCGEWNGDVRRVFADRIF
ncbi:MAG: glutamate--cysteine ligase [Hyphomicrobiaceae bacterium]